MQKPARRLPREFHFSGSVDEKSDSAWRQAAVDGKSGQNNTHREQLAPIIREWMSRYHGTNGATA